MNPNKDFEEMVIRKIIAELSYYADADFHKPEIMSLVTKTTMMTLVDVQDDNPGFDAKANFAHDPEPLITVDWWIGMQGKVNQFQICLDPLEVRRDPFDPIAAYNRAMSIL